jgi:hypothetical protein
MLEFLKKAPRKEKPKRYQNDIAPSRPWQKERDFITRSRRKWVR